MTSFTGLVFLMHNLLEDDDSDSDQEETEKKRKRRRRSSDRLTVMKEKLLKKHPLSIQFNVTCGGKQRQDLNNLYICCILATLARSNGRGVNRSTCFSDGSTLQLTFYYLMALHIVTVQVRVKHNSTASSISGA